MITWKADDIGDEMDAIVAASARVPGWTEGDDARAIAQASYDLPDNAVIVEVGVFMGRCTVLLAGARRLRGSGRVYCVDPFDCSGEPFSVPYYQAELRAMGKATLTEVFDGTIAEQGIGDWVEVLRQTAEAAASYWEQPIDLLLLDGDQSPMGARRAYDLWTPFLKPGGVIVLRNTRDRVYAEGHDGHRRLAVEEVHSPYYSEVRQVGATTIGIRQYTVAR